MCLDALAITIHFEFNELQSSARVAVSESIRDPDLQRTKTRASLRFFPYTKTPHNIEFHVPTASEESIKNRAAHVGTSIKIEFILREFTKFLAAALLIVFPGGFVSRAQENECRSRSGK